VCRDHHRRRQRPAVEALSQRQRCAQRAQRRRERGHQQLERRRNDRALVRVSLFAHRDVETRELRARFRIAQRLEQRIAPHQLHEDERHLTHA